MQEPVAMTANELDKKIGKFLRKYAYVDKRNIQSFTESFCNHFQLTAIPREPNLLLPEHFGIQIVRNDKCQTPAQWMLNEIESRYIINVSGHIYGPLMAIRLWHEFFEIMSSNKYFPSRLPSDMECNLSNLFAVNLLMPEKEIKEQANSLGHPHQHDKTDVLANRFGVSHTAMIYRLKELCLQFRKPPRRYY